MKPLNNSLTASLFTLGNGGYSTPDALLPSEALVIVIQDRVITMAPLQPLQWQNSHRLECESVQAIRRKAEKAYSEHRRAGASIINVSG
jgi:hypothetical protein